MTTIATFDAAEFRRRLAGLADTAGGTDLVAGEFRELASDYVLLLALCFNRRALEAQTLWTRIGSAIAKGLSECGNGDVERFVSTGLAHVLATSNAIAAHPESVRIQCRLYGLSEDERVGFLQYLAKHLAPALVFGRQKWEEQRAELFRRMPPEPGAEYGGEAVTQANVMESGSRASGLFDDPEQE